MNGSALTLPNDVQSALVARLERLKEDIAQSISSHGLTASGRTASSMYVVAESDNVTLYGRSFFAALETGSSAWTGRTGVPCTFYEFKEIIRNWASSKGLNFGQARDYERAVGAIAMTIIRTGTKQKRSGRRLDVYTTLVNEATEDCAMIAANVIGAQVDNVISQWS